MLVDVGNIYNELYYMYKIKYNKKNSLNTKNRIKLNYKKLRLTDNYDYPSEEEQEEKLKETITDVNKFNEWINKEETNINTELFKKHFNFQRASDMLKSRHKVNTNQNNELVNVFNSGLKDLKE